MKNVRTLTIVLAIILFIVMVTMGSILRGKGFSKLSVNIISFIVFVPATVVIYLIDYIRRK